MTSERLNHLVSIANALISTGKYTLDKQEANGDSILWKDDFGRDWKENGFSCRYPIRLIEDVEEVYSQILRIKDEGDGGIIPQEPPQIVSVDVR